MIEFSMLTVGMIISATIVAVPYVLMFSNLLFSFWWKFVNRLEKVPDNFFHFFFEDLFKTMLFNKERICLNKKTDLRYLVIV